MASGKGVEPGQGSVSQRNEEPTNPFPPGFGLEDLVSFGQIGLVVLDKQTNTAIKFPFSHRDPEHHIWLQREQSVYERLARKGEHEGLLTYYGSCGFGIRLEYSPTQVLRAMLLADRLLPAESRFSDVQRVRWALQIANTLSFIHSAGVIHGDLSCRNILMDANFNAKVFDFAGSSIDGSPLLMDLIDEGYRFPGPTRLCIQGDLFALGCLMYEIMTNQPPNDGVEPEMIRRLYSQRNFPPTNYLGGIGTIIEVTWRAGYADASEVALALKGELDAITASATDSQSSDQGFSDWGTPSLTP